MGPGLVNPCLRSRRRVNTAIITKPGIGQVEGMEMDEETKALLRSIAHHLRWVIALLVAIIALLIAGVLE